MEKNRSVMTLTLSYNFEVECDVLRSDSYDYPDYNRKMCEIEYEYEAEITMEDIYDFFETQFGTLNDSQKELIKNLYENDFLTDLSDDDEFRDYCYESFKEQAYEACRDDNSY